MAKDYTQACLVLADSPEASAALSRRCLQGILRREGFGHHNLADQIKAVLDAHALPTRIADSIDAIRNIGNFAAHPTKDTATGTIMDVETGEAEWNLDVLEMLFDFYFVQPAQVQLKIDALNAKLAAAGKPAMK